MGFIVERRTSGTTTFEQVGVVGADVLSFIDQGVDGSETYYYRVLAFNHGGDSAYSNEATPTGTALRATRWEMYK
jgi:hypothetical protein